jgi:hypothetical protein
MKYRGDKSCSAASIGVQPGDKEFQYFLHSSIAMQPVTHRKGHTSVQPMMDSADAIYTCRHNFRSGTTENIN